MKTRLKNVRLYNKINDEFETGDLCFENGVISNLSQFTEDEVIDAKNNILIPNFLSFYGEIYKFAKFELGLKNANEISNYIADTYFSNGYSKIVEEIDDFDVVKNLAEKRIQIEIVSDSPKLIKKILGLNKANLTCGVKIDVLEEVLANQLIDIALKNKLTMYADLYSTLERAGEISNQYNKSPIEVARDFGMLDGKLVLVDSVYIDKEDISQIKNDDVVFALSPKTNTILGLGFEPIELIQRYANSIGFACKNIYGLDGFENMRACLGIGRASMNDVDLISEKNVVEYLIFGDELMPKINTIASFLLIDDKNLPMQCKDINQVVKLCSSRDITYNFVGGKIVYKKI